MLREDKLKDLKRECKGRMIGGERRERWREKIKNKGENSTNDLWIIFVSESCQQFEWLKRCNDVPWWRGNSMLPPSQSMGLEQERDGRRGEWQASNKKNRWEGERCASEG